MSMHNPQTGRYADDLMAKLRDRTATVGDVIDHAQEIIVDAPACWGTAVTEPVRLLLVVINALESGLDVQQNHNVVELDDELR